MDNKYLKMARQAREEDNAEDAKKFYDMARTEDPDNAEAKFFFQYYSLMDCKNGEIPVKYDNVEKSAYSTIKMLGKSDYTAEDKFDLLSQIVDAFLPLAASMWHHMLGLSCFDYSDTIRMRNNHIRNAKELGNTIIDTFGEEKGLHTDLAVKCWKEAIDFDFACCNYLNYKDKDKEVWMHKYAKKIQKYDPSYKMPEYKQAGCLATGDAASAQPRSED